MENDSYPKDSVSSIADNEKAVEQQQEEEEATAAVAEDVKPGEEREGNISPEAGEREDDDQHQQQQGEEEAEEEDEENNNDNNSRSYSPQPPSSPSGDNMNSGNGSNQQSVAGRWTDEEHDLFLQGLKLYGKEWKKIATLIKTRTVVQVRTHAQKYFQKVAKQHGGGSMSTASTAMNSSTSISARSTRNRKRTALLQDDEDDDEENDESDDYVEDGVSTRHHSASLRGSSSPERPSMSSISGNNTRSRTRSAAQSEVETFPKRPRLPIIGINRPFISNSPPMNQGMKTLMSQPPNQQLNQIQSHQPFEMPRLRKIDKTQAGNENSAGDFGGVTPRTVAAATILLRPRLQQKLAQGAETPKTRETAEWMKRNEGTAARVLSQLEPMSWTSAASSSTSHP